MKLIYTFLVLFVLVSCKKAPTQLTKITAKTTVVDSTVASTTTITDFVAPYKKQLTTKMEQVLSYTPINLTREDGKLQSTLGNLMADMCLDIANPLYQEKTNNTIDFAMFNNGGIRAPIPKGAVTMQHAFQLMPFENELVVATLTGEKVAELVSFFIENNRAHPLSKEINLILDGKDYTLMIHGKPLERTKTYNVLTSDYLQNGGDHMDFFKNPVTLTPLDYKVRDAIIDYFKKTDTIKVSLDNRVISKQ